MSLRADVLPYAMEGSSPLKRDSFNRNAGLVRMKTTARIIAFELDVELGGLPCPCCDLRPDGAVC